jgi:hypothetical protein
MLSTPFEFQIVLTPKRMHHTESATLMLSLQKFPRTPVILDIGSKLKPSGKVLTASGVTDGPFAEAKEIVAGFMIIAADDYEGAVAVVKAMPGMQMPGACVEIREMAPF